MITIQASWEWWVIFVWSIVPYTPLIVGAIKNPKDESHNALVWSLYTMLDGITFLTGIRMLKTLNPVVMGLTMEGRENADPMVLGFAVGSLIMALILFYQKDLRAGE